MNERLPNQPFPDPDNPGMLEFLSHGPVVFFLRRNDARRTVAFITGNIFELTGYSREDFAAGRSLSDLIHPEDAKRVTEELQYFTELMKREHFQHQPYRLIHRDGNVRWVREYARLLKVEGETALFTFGYLIDYTSHKNNIDALMLESVKYRSFFEKHSAIFLLIDPSTGRIAKANRSAAAFYGYPIQDLERMNIHEINTLPSDEVRNRMEEARILRRNYFVFPHRRKSGEIRTVEDHSTPIEIYDRTYLFSIIYDISERVKLEERLRELVRGYTPSTQGKSHEPDRVFLIQQAKTAAMRETLSAVANQWKQPLNAVSLMVQYILELNQKRQLSPDVLENTMHDLKKQLGYMSRTIDEFRDFFDTAAGETSFNTHETVADCLLLIQDRLGHHQIKVTVNQEDFQAHGSPGHLKQAIMNVLNNSVDAIERRQADRPDLAGLIDVTITASRRRIAITDNGGGVPEKIASRIFEPFFTTTPEGGTGLGLTIARMAIDNLSGTISLENTSDGARFVIEI